MTTGYFAARNGRRSKVHIVLRGKPICGARTRNDYHGNGVHRSIVECSRCLAADRRAASETERTP